MTGRGDTCTPSIPLAWSQGTEGPFAKCQWRVRRRNHAGDREKALSVLLPMVKREEGAVPDLLCLCGRIYKDMFISSGFTEARDEAFYW